MGRMQAIIMILCCLTKEIRTSQTGQFIGASMSFTIINGTNGFEVQLDVISGWVLGLGPCGINCSRDSINSDTKATREEVLQKQGNSRFFGNWSVEFKTSSMKSSQVKDINQVVYSSLNESVVDVSENARWEQVWTVVRYPMIPDTPYMDIGFEGSSWRNLSLQGDNVTWHLQMKATPQLRSDIGKPNNSPQAISRPLYRLLLDKDNHIRIATIDPDGDQVICSISEYIEVGFLSNHLLPNISVTKDCIITIPSNRTLGYHNGSIGAVAITVSDYNVSGVTYGQRLTPFSAIGVQFLVQFLDNISEPFFIFPTPEGNHRFNIYSGTTWKIDVYAKPISPALIDHFTCLGRQHEDVKIINVKSTSVPNHLNVKMATMTWTPFHTDVGKHILCVGVEDSYG
ncbi:hypothetical protein ACJMK2_036769 [Sinanodonta woodiana]|uniref:Uncharacterized protein n=1 Tax=Sinanodonta woodiana TaxID=1069815 RepID=A0ABD3WI82_SINWO